MSERVRMTLDLSHRLNATIERMAEQRQQSKADVVRAAIAALAAAEQAKSEGFSVGAWSEDRAHELEFILT